MNNISKNTIDYVRVELYNEIELAAKSLNSYTPPPIENPSITHYVLGFMIDVENNNVVLIRKSRPDYQKGKINGIGGKVSIERDYDHIGSGTHEYDHKVTYPRAMVREFKEETGIDTYKEEWHHITDIEFKGGNIIHVYALYYDPAKIDLSLNRLDVNYMSNFSVYATDEGVSSWYNIDEVLSGNKYLMVRHISWLLAMAKICRGMKFEVKSLNDFKDV